MAADAAPEGGVACWNGDRGEFVHRPSFAPEGEYPLIASKRSDPRDPEAGAGERSSLSEPRKDDDPALC
jgi:hypothetical protein